MNALDYLLKANLYALLFAGCYWLLLRRHTFFGVNRAYLLASVVLALTLPLASLPTQTLNALPAEMTAPVGVIALPVMTVSATVPDHPAVSAAVISPTAAHVDWPTIILWLYGAVASFLLIRLGARVTKLLRIINASAQERRDGYVLVQPKDTGMPTFSFFRYLVRTPADADSALILQHELVHIRQWHSADVLVLALFRAVFWACPALWLLERAVREVHEFLADRVAIRQVPDQPERQGVEHYARFLVDYAFGVRPDVLTNGFFNPSLLKRRIQMMQERTTNRWALGKYALVLPLAFGLLAMTTARKEITTVFSNTITITGRVTRATDGKPLPGAAIVVKGTTKGTTTTPDGRYRLDGLIPTQSIVISYVGFTTQEFDVAGRTIINVALESEPNKSEKIVVMGYESEPTTPTKTAEQPASLTSKTGEVSPATAQRPEFVGGMSKLGEYLAKHLRYPTKAVRANITGIVLVRFMVAQDGSISDAYVEKGIGGGCNEEALRIVNQMPRWRPGKQNGRPVAVPYVLPIEFGIERTKRHTGYDEPTFKPLNSPIGDFSMVTKREMLQFKDQSMNRYSMPAPASSMGVDIEIKPRHTRWSYVRDSVRIGGNGPLGALGDDQQPLMIVDGLEIDRDDFTKQVSPNDIKEMTVLKDAEATALYGLKGKNGVILITTKKP